MSDGDAQDQQKAETKATTSSPPGLTARVKALHARIKENYFLSLLVLFGSLVVAISTFSDGLRNLINSVHEIAAPNLSGKWETDTLDNPYDRREQYRLSFDLDIRSSNVSGTVTETSEDDDYTKGRKYEFPIIEGKLDHEEIRFKTNFTVSDESSNEASQLKTYSEFYEGTRTKDGLALRRWDDQPGYSPIQKFVARRPAVAPGPPSTFSLRRR